MRIIRAKDYEDMSRKAANIISSVMTLKPDCVLGLATGSSPVGTYKHLIRRYENGDLDFSRVTSVNLDEYKGLDRENSQSYYYFMRENLFSHVNIRMENTHIPDGTEADSEKACSAYNEILHKVGSVDLQLLGIGHDGHIGFNEPADTLQRDPLRGSYRYDHRSKRTFLCQQGRGADTGIHHGNSDDHVCKKSPDGSKRRG